MDAKTIIFLVLGALMAVGAILLYVLREQFRFMRDLVGMSRYKAAQKPLWRSVAHIGDALKKIASEHTDFNTLGISEGDKDNE